MGIGSNLLPRFVLSDATVDGSLERIGWYVDTVVLCFFPSDTEVYEPVKITSAKQENIKISLYFTIVITVETSVSIRRNVLLTKSKNVEIPAESASASEKSLPLAESRRFGNSRLPAFRFFQDEAPHPTHCPFSKV